MAEHTIHYRFAVPLSREKVFAFFADAGNLARITPPELEFAILTPRPIPMARGTLIEYRLKLFGIPFGWQTLISTWLPPDRFVDEQLTGPYRQWIHSHTFSEAPHGGTVIDDLVRYRLPFPPFGEVAYPLVRRQLDRIFSYREDMVTTILMRGDHNRTKDTADDQS